MINVDKFDALSSEIDLKPEFVSNSEKYRVTSGLFDAKTFSDAVRLIDWKPELGREA